MTLDEYLRKHGWRSLGILIEAFIERSPAFDGDLDLARHLGEMVADLESALQDYMQKNK